MISVTPQYVSPDDFKLYWSVDLVQKSGGHQNAEIFLRRIEDRLMTWIDANTFRIVSWEELKESYVFPNENDNKNIKKQREAWQKAILTQAYYIYRNSDLTTDSGYDPGKGVVIPREEIDKIEICRAAIDFIKAAGLYNHTVTNRYRYTVLP